MNSVFYRYSKFAFIKNICLRLEQKLQFYRLVSCCVFILIWWQCQSSRHIMHWNRTIQNCPWVFTQIKTLFGVHDIQVLVILSSPKRLLKVYFLRLVILHISYRKFGITFARVQKVQSGFGWVFDMYSPKINDLILNWI